MFKRLIAYFTRKLGNRSAQSQPCGASENAAPDRVVLLHEVRARRDEAKAAAESAEARNDDRDRGRSYMVLRQATSDLLRLEVGR